MITPAFTGQYYQDTTTKKLWKANSTTPGDWTAVGNVNKSGAGDPTGVETPDFTGQTYRDTATGNIWTSTGLTNADWTLTVQDMQWSWLPNTSKLGEIIGIGNYSDGPGITNITFNGVTSLNGLDLELFNDLLSYSAPNLTSVADGAFYLVYCDLLNTINLPLLTIVGGGSLGLYNNPVLTTISLNSLVTVLNRLDIYLCPLLVTISIPNYLPTNGQKQDFHGDALSLASVDHILDRCVANPAYVSGEVDISGGTNTAPTQGAGSSHDILVARGVTITHN